MEATTKEINGTTYVLKMFPTMTGLRLVQTLQREGFAPEVIREVVTKGASIGSTAIDEKKFDSHFRGKYAELMELFAEVLKYNDLFPDESEGKEEGSEEGA